MNPKQPFKQCLGALLCVLALSAHANDSLTSHERSKVFQAIARIDALIDFYEGDVLEFTLHESPERLRQYLLSLASMRVKMKLMMRLPFGLTHNLHELQELKGALAQKTLPELVSLVESGKI